MTARLHKLLTARVGQTSGLATNMWLVLSLFFSALYGLQGLLAAFSGSYLVDDDARQHVFWMQRFMDPELFPNDIIAEYFQSTAPPGYTALYQFMALAGIDPLISHKILPLLLGLVITIYCFGLFLQILPVPAGAFVAALLLNQALWQKGDLLSGTPKAFYLVFLLPFLYYLLRGSVLPSLGAIALQGLFNPLTVFISAGILALWPFTWDRGLPRVSRKPTDYLMCGAGLAVAMGVVLIYALKSSQFGPVIVEAQAKALPEFQSQGRTAFFLEDQWMFWLSGARSGILTRPLQPPLLWVGLALPLVLLRPSRFPLVSQLTPGVRPLPQILVASFGMFVLAHALLFRFYYPSRHTDHTLRLVAALAAAIVVTLLLDAILRPRREARFASKRWPLGLAVTALSGFVLVSYPNFARLVGERFPETHYTIGRVPDLYEFFLQQPKDIVIASLTEEADFLPTFAKRSIVVGREYTATLHFGYHRQIRERATDLISAQYGRDISDVRRVIQKYGIDFWLLEESSFDQASMAPRTWRWIHQYQPAASRAQAMLERGELPALGRVREQCTVLRTDRQVVLDAVCLLKSPHETAGSTSFGTTQP